MSTSAIRKIINGQLEKPLSYTAYKFLIKSDSDLSTIKSKTEEKKETIAGN